jgi:DNA-binding HxlR family transcriptional regulator
VKKNQQLKQIRKDMKVIQRQTILKQALRELGEVKIVMKQTRKDMKVIQSQTILKQALRELGEVKIVR